MMGRIQKAQLALAIETGDLCELRQLVEHEGIDAFDTDHVSTHLMN